MEKQAAGGNSITNCVISYTQFYKAVLRIKKTPVCMHPQESVILPWQGRDGGLLNGHRPVRVRVGKGFCMPKDCMCQEMGCFKVHFVRKLWRLWYIFDVYSTGLFLCTWRRGRYQTFFCIYKESSHAGAFFRCDIGYKNNLYPDFKVRRRHM